MRQTIASSVVITVCLVPAAFVSAKPEFVAKIPNGANVPGVEALGHVDPAGDGARNAFGEGFDEADFVWTTELCQADSDGDGQTNGQELGDPCCEFVVDTNPDVRWTEGVSHPGDSSLTSDPSLWAAIDCSNVTSAAGNATDSSNVGGNDEGSGDASAETPSPTNTATTHERALIAGATAVAAAIATLW